MSGSNLLVVAVLLPIVSAAVTLFAPSRRAPAIASAFLALQCAVVGLVSSAARASGGIAMDITWIPAFGSHLRLQADAISVFFSVLLSVTCFLASLYSVFYFGHDNPKPVFFSLVLLFVGSMQGVLMAGDLVLFYLFWELMLIPSTALLVYWGQGKNPVATGLKYFIVTHIGAVLILAATIWAMVVSGTSEMSAVRKALMSLEPGSMHIMAAMFFAGFAVKMAVFPGHIWLPDAHSEAQLPVSILLSAAMMNMGAYGLIRYASTVLPLGSVMWLGRACLVFGLVNQWYGGIKALRQTELKRMAAYSTISQMGYVLIGLSAMFTSGNLNPARGVLAQLMAHAIGKALLFMVIGAVIHASGERSFGRLGGLSRSMPLTMLCAVVAALTLSGAPPFAAFQSEWLIMAGVARSFGAMPVVLGLSGSVLSALYCLSFVRRIFYGQSDMPVEREVPAGGMVLSMLCAALISLVVGVWPGLAGPLVSSAAIMALQ